MRVQGSEGDSRRVLALTDQEVQSISVGDIKAYLALLTEDAIFMPPASHAKEGEELREWLRDCLERFTVEYLEFVHLDTMTMGSLGYHSFTYRWRVTPKAGGDPVVAHGKGLHILRRQLDGFWKIAREIWNGSPPP